VILFSIVCVEKKTLASRESKISKISRQFDWRGTELRGSIQQSMKRWAAFTVLLYALALLLLTAPAILIAFGNWGLKGSDMNLKGALQLYLQWGYWLWLAVLLAGQSLLLLLPIDIAEKRLPTRRKLKIPVIVTTFFLANLFLAGIFSILCAIFTDGAFRVFDFLNPSTAVGSRDNSGFGAIAGVILTALAFWIIWAIIFRHFAKSDGPDALLKRIVRWLLRGSILELIIAVPSHVIVRRNLLGHRHWHFRHAALLWPRRLFFVRRKMQAAATEGGGRK
jgi:hypothetical protein